jgi:CSLREA domain-containing protein
MSRTSYLRRPLTALLVAVALAVSVVMAVVVLASPAWAATYTVNSTADTDDGACTSVSGGCTLREAINAANSTTGVADTINFNLGSAATITLTSAQLPPITDVAGLTIDGGSADITISGDNKYRVFEVGSGAKLTLSNLTVANAHYSSSGGGIDNYGTLTVSNSTLSSNIAARGGGIFNELSGTLTVSNSTLSGNSTDYDAGGGIWNSGTATVSNSTLSGNSVPDGLGGGIVNYDGTLTVSNSTLFSNSASEGSGIFNSRGATATLKNTIVAKSLSGGSCFGTITNGGYNLDSGTSCGFPAQNSSKDPLLGTLADNGGPTKTHALLAGSPALDKGNSFSVTTDQRGLVRPSNFVGIVNAADGSDIGAFELQAPPTQPDTTPPKVTSTVPPLVNEIAPTINVKATFSEDMLVSPVSSITGQTFKLFKKGSTTKKAATVSYNADTDTAKLDAANNLRRGVTYKAVVSTGAKDLAGNQLDQNGSTTGLQQKVWYFTVDN